MILYRFIALAIGYICGMLVSGFFFAKRKNIDLRTKGSGNIGTTNTLRVLGPAYGALTLLCDCLKAILAAGITALIFHNRLDAAGLRLIMLYACAGAVLGHVFPAILRFKGGKGVATSLGLMLVVFPQTFPFCFIAFAIIFVTTHYVSLGSIVCAVLFPLQVVIFTAKGFFGYANPYAAEEAVIACCIGALVIWLHRSNISRLLAGTENKVSLTKKA